MRKGTVSLYYRETVPFISYKKDAIFLTLI